MHQLNTRHPLDRHVSESKPVPTEPPAPPGQRAPRLMERAGDRLRARHYSYRTEQSYLGWIKRYILFHNKRHPKEMREPEIEAFVSHLASQRGVSASTQMGRGGG